MTRGAEIRTLPFSLDGSSAIINQRWKTWETTTRGQYFTVVTQGQWCQKVSLQGNSLRFKIGLLFESLVYIEFYSWRKQRDSFSNGRSNELCYIGRLRCSQRCGIRQSDWLLLVICFVHLVGWFKSVNSILSLYYT